MTDKKMIWKINFKNLFKSKIYICGSFERMKGREMALRIQTCSCNINVYSKNKG